MSIQVSLFGRIGSEPQIRQVGGDNQIATASVAVGHNRKNQAGEYETDWYRLNVWNKRANYFSDAFYKGARIYATGDLEINHYTANDGTLKETKDITVTEFRVIDKNENTQNKAQQNPSNLTENHSDLFSGNKLEIDDEDLPF